MDALTVADLVAHPVWRFTDREAEDEDETYVRAVSRLPTTSLDGKLVGTRIRLANGTRVWGLLGNVDTRDARSTQHFVSLMVLRRGRRFVLARYHDRDHAKNGPAALARFLELSVDEVFPITYDVRAHAKGDADALVGTITKKPRERLTRAQLFSLAV